MPVFSCLNKPLFPLYTPPHTTADAVLAHQTILQFLVSCISLTLTAQRAQTPQVKRSDPQDFRHQSQVQAGTCAPDHWQCIGQSHVISPFSKIMSPVVIPSWYTSCQHISAELVSVCDHAFTVLLCEDTALTDITTSWCGHA